MAVNIRQKVEGPPKKPMNDKEAEQAIAEFMEKVIIDLSIIILIIVKPTLFSAEHPGQFLAKNQEELVSENHG